MGATYAILSALGKWHLRWHLRIINSERGPEITLFASLTSFGGTPSNPMAVVRLKLEMIFSMSELLASLKENA